MKHRHSGKYTARTPKGKIVKKRKPLHKRTSKKSCSPKRISDKDKNLTWKQVHKKYPCLHPFADTDGDGVPNYKDCRPLNKKAQDFGMSREEARRRDLIDEYDREKEVLDTMDRGEIQREEQGLLKTSFFGRPKGEDHRWVNDLVEQSGLKGDEARAYRQELHSALEEENE